MTHDILIWQERTNLANLNMFAQWSLISTTVTLLEIHGHFYSQKVCISCKNTQKKFGLHLLMWKGLHYNFWTICHVSCPHWLGSKNVLHYIFLALISVGSSSKSLWMVESRSMCSSLVHQVSVVKVPSGVAGPLWYSHLVVIFSVVYYSEFMLCSNFLLNLPNFAEQSTLGVP
jgi:hypothetical protein